MTIDCMYVSVGGKSIFREEFDSMEETTVTGSGS